MQFAVKLGDDDDSEFAPSNSSYKSLYEMLGIMNLAVIAVPIL